MNEYCKTCQSAVLWPDGRIRCTHELEGQFLQACPYYQVGKPTIMPMEALQIEHELKRKPRKSRKTY